MLSIMRQHAGSWIIKVLLFAIVLVFVFWGVGSFRNREATHLGTVNGDTISYELYVKTYNAMLDQFRRIYGSNLSDEMLRILRPKEKALDNLVYRLLTLQEARRLGFQVTEQELDKAIREIPAFQENGVFDEKKATQILALNNFSTADFRESYKEDLLLNKMRALILQGAVVSEEEARNWYDWTNAQINLSYYMIDPQRYKDVSPTDEEVKAYFEEHKEAYKTEPQVKVRYLVFDPKTFEDKTTVTDEAVSSYYNEHQDEFTIEKTVEARHILLRVDANADDKVVEEKKAKAKEIADQARKGKDFADLAKQHSEDGTREKGGYLGAFKKDAMVKPFADAAFSMKAGEISDPVRTQFGWHVIKVEKVNEAQTQTLEQAKETIATKLVAEKARTLAYEKAENVYENLFDGQDLVKAGEAHGVPVVTTEFFKRDEPPKEGIQNDFQFAETAFKLEKMAISEILDLGGSYALMQVIDRLEPSIPALDAVAENVKSDVVKKQQHERAKNDAQKLLSTLEKNEAAPQDLSDIEVQETGFFGRTGSIPKIGYEPDILQPAFELSNEAPFAKEPLEGKQGWFVIKLKERKSPDAEGYEKEKAGVIAQLTEQKKQSAMEQWLEDVKSRSQIDINHKLIQ